MLTYADVMLTYAGVCWRMLMLTYAGVCGAADCAADLLEAVMSAVTACPKACVLVHYPRR
jgi:hypothetical protein